jgi:hypothetical protein
VTNGTSIVDVPGGKTLRTIEVRGDASPAAGDALSPVATSMPSVFTH